MDALKWVVLLFFGFLSVVPVIVLSQYRSVEKYRSLRHLITAIFWWSILLFLLHLVENLTFSYYTQMLIFPTVFAIVYFCHETVQSFVRKKTPKLIKYAFYSFFLLNLIMSSTNQFHLAMLIVPIDSISSVDDLIFSEIGWFFYIHLAVSYTVIVIVVTRLLKFLRSTEQVDIDRIPFYLVLASVIIGLSLNVLHLFIYTFYIDPTYLAIVSFGFTLYIVIYKRDFHINLLNRGHNEIINSMREKVIIADHKGEIIEFSHQISEFLNEDIQRQNLDEIMKKISEKAVVYEKFKDIQNQPFSSEKPYFFTRTQDLTLPTYNESGKLVLMYDETRVVELVDKLNYLRNYDQMTGLYNRNYFEEHRENYEKECEFAALILLDLNGLKMINDFFGHKRGDDWIIRLAKVLNANTTKEGEYAIRMGGDEFLLFYENSQDSDLESVIQTVDQKLSSKDISKHISLSYGIAYRKNKEPLEKVLSRADKRLYAMKIKRSPDYKDALKKLIEKNKTAI